ncbi:TPA: PilL N-terminal domain-containing protein [Pseudomonas aeruginosa]
MPPIFLPQRLACSALLAAAVLAGGCSTTPPQVPKTSDRPATESAEQPPEYIPVVRQGRYTLVELAPAAAQRDLLLQLVDVSLPADAHASVRDGLLHVLKRSGYGLCDADSASGDLYSLPLPLAHQRLGPMTLRDALLTLAGPAWSLLADDQTRQICFIRADDASATAHAADAAGNNNAASATPQTFPVKEGARP